MPHLDRNGDNGFKQCFFYDGIEAYFEEDTSWYAAARLGLLCDPPLKEGLKLQMARAKLEATRKQRLVLRYPVTHTRKQIDAVLNRFQKTAETVLIGPNWKHVLAVCRILKQAGSYPEGPERERIISKHIAHLESPAYMLESIDTALKVARIRKATRLRRFLGKKRVSPKLRGRIWRFTRTTYKRIKSEHPEAGIDAWKETLKNEYDFEKDEKRSSNFPPLSANRLLWYAQHKTCPK
jgi:hypothetical protein